MYRSELNEQFYELRFSIGPALEIEKVGETLEIQLLELASTYKKNQPWSLIDSSDLLVFEDQTKGQQLYCVVMGQLGEVLGMAVYVGEAGYQSMI
nr:hypothetical protein [Shouchella patagoniensis]